MKLYRRAPQWLHDDKQFLEEYVAKVPGWLFDYTAARTMDLLRWQEEQKKEGSLLEIGVFAGRYFSILARSALRTGSRIVGLDTFQFVSEQELHEQHLRFIFELHPDVVFLARPSTAVTAQTLLAVLELPARFISIDGSHEAADVHWDLRLAEELLAPDGIVAVRRRAPLLLRPPRTRPLRLRGQQALPVPAGLHADLQQSAGAGCRRRRRPSAIHPVRRRPGSRSQPYPSPVMGARVPQRPLMRPCCGGFSLRLAQAAAIPDIGDGRLALDVPLANRVRSGRKQP